MQLHIKLIKLIIVNQLSPNPISLMMRLVMKDHQVQVECIKKNTVVVEVV